MSVLQNWTKDSILLCSLSFLDSAVVAGVHVESSVKFGWRKETCGCGLSASACNFACKSATCLDKTALSFCRSAITDRSLETRTIIVFETDFQCSNNHIHIISLLFRRLFGLITGLLLVSVSLFAFSSFVRGNFIDCLLLMPSMCGFD